MCSRVLLVCALLLIASDSRAEIGGHRLEFVVSADWIDFDRAIRFEDDLAIGVAVLAEIMPGASLGLEFSHAGVRDRERDEFSDVYTAAIRARVEPFARARWSVGAVVGISFLAFENQPSIDSVSEGFELGPSLRWNAEGPWRVRAEWIWRVQTVSRQRLGPGGVPTGEQDETGYLLSSLARMGVGIGF